MKHDSFGLIEWHGSFMGVRYELFLEIGNSYTHV